MESLEDMSWEERFRAAFLWGLREQARADAAEAQLLQPDQMAARHYLRASVEKRQRGEEVR